MGSERGSTIRRREAGKICTYCDTPLDPPPPDHKVGYKTGERFCDRCAPRPHKVTMKFELRGEQWHVFLSASSKHLRTYTFASPEKIRDMAEKGGAFKCLADRQAVEYGLTQEPYVGACQLNLTEKQWLRVI